MLKKMLFFTLLFSASTLYGMVSEDEYKIDENNDGKNEIEEKLPTNPISKLLWNIQYPIKHEIKLRAGRNFEFAQPYPEVNQLLINTSNKFDDTDEIVEVWDLNEKTLKHSMKIQASNTCNFVALAPKHNTLAWFNKDSNCLFVNSFRVASTLKIHCFDDSGIHIRELAFSSDEKAITTLGTSIKIDKEKGSYDFTYHYNEMNRKTFYNFPRSMKSLPNVIEPKLSLFHIAHAQHYQNLLPYLCDFDVFSLSPDNMVLAALRDRTITLFDTKNEKMIYNHTFSEEYSYFEHHNGCIVYILTSEPTALYIINLFIPHGS